MNGLLSLNVYEDTRRVERDRVSTFWNLLCVGFRLAAPASGTGRESKSCGLAAASPERHRAMGAVASSEAPAEAAQVTTIVGSSSGSEQPAEANEPTISPPTRAVLKAKPTFSALTPVFEISAEREHHRAFSVSLTRPKRTHGIVAIDGLALASARDAEGQPIRASRSSSFSRSASSRPASRLAQRNSLPDASELASSSTHTSSRGRHMSMPSFATPWRRGANKPSSSESETAELGWGGDRAPAPEGLSHALPKRVPDDAPAPAPGHPTSNATASSSSSSSSSKLLEA